MRRLALLLAAPLLLSAAGPLAEAEREAREAAAEQQRLEQAAAEARGEAGRASAEAEAAAQAMIAADARIAASEARLAQLQQRRAALERRLAEARRPATALLAGLAEVGRRPQWLALAGAAGAEEQVRLAILVRQLRPEIERRTASLRGELEVLARLAEQQRSQQEELGRQRLAAAEARTRFAALERTALAAAEARGRAAVDAGDRVIVQGEQLATLGSEAERRRAAARLAAELGELPASQPRPVAAEGKTAAMPFGWQVPASGAITTGFGEVLPNGVRTRGLTIAAARGTKVRAPAAGQVVFAGPFRRRAGVVILDHGDGWKTLLSEVRSSVRVGERVGPGARVGRALGPVTAELFFEGKAEPAALIARSS
jgi:septal ring factor EnvC (AmiA/AmiB activator)